MSQQFPQLKRSHSHKKKFELPPSHFKKVNTVLDILQNRINSSAASKSNKYYIRSQGGYPLSQISSSRLNSSLLFPSKPLNNSNSIIFKKTGVSVDNLSSRAIQSYKNASKHMKKFHRVSSSSVFPELKYQLERPANEMRSIQKNIKKAYKGNILPKISGDYNGVNLNIAEAHNEKIATALANEANENNNR